MKTGAGRRLLTADSGRLQLVAAASLRIWFWYSAWTSASPSPCQARRVVGREVGRDPGHVLEVDLAEVDPAEVERDQGQEQEDGQDERELDEALAAVSAMAVDAASSGERPPAGEKRIWGPAVRVRMSAADARRGTFHGPFNRCAPA